ncbi:hypothetical protein [Paraburkholderia sp. SOS3]|jgi:hypothetical protein|uniref:hypothetical protein n=1 Tax=Paraburkholderia sp. SOS3 TaxID=1926494 RepID=UPI0018DD52AD|nr:hypothetical protein [Paraburkholderia sp. SOS3]
MCNGAELFEFRQSGNVCTPEHVAAIRFHHGCPSLQFLQLLMQYLDALQMRAAALAQTFRHQRADQIDDGGDPLTSRATSQIAVRCRARA